MIFLYGCVLAVFVFLLKWLEYRYLLRDLSVEFYMGVIAVFFTAIGIWTGLKLVGKKKVVVEVPVPDFVFDESRLQQLGISKREYEVLELMAQGLSNQEIADKLFVSPNTVKTHTSNLFLKLEVGRRTQAIQKAKKLRLIP
jgi:NarL family two-component system response regulator LiaR